VLGKTQRGSWNIYSINKDSFKVTPVYETAAALSSLSLNDTYIHFTATDKKTKQFYRLNRQTNQVTQLSKGSYLKSGVETDTSILGLVINAQGENIVRQKKSAPVAASLPTEASYNLVHTKKISKKEIALNHSLKGALSPYVYPLPIMGEDELGTLRYSALYTPMTGLSVDVTTLLWRPWQLGVFSQYGASYITASRPLYKSLSSGINSLNLGVLTDLKDANYISWSSSYSFRDHRGSVQGVNQLRTGTSRFTWADRHSYKDFSYKWQLKSSQGLSAINYIRGLKNESLSHAYGSNSSLDIMKRLMDVSLSSWSPSAALGSLYAGVFLDHSTYSNQQAYGVYLSQEAKGTLLGLAIVPSIGYAFSKNEQSLYITVEGSLSF
jgi:hypothetical protein